MINIAASVGRVIARWVFIDTVKFLQVFEMMTCNDEMIVEENKLVQKIIWSQNFIEHSATKRHEHEPHMTQGYFTQEYFQTNSVFHTEFNTRDHVSGWDVNSGVKWKKVVVQNQPHSLTPATPKFQQFLNN